MIMMMAMAMPTSINYNEYVTENVGDDDDNDDGLLLIMIMLVEAAGRYFR